LLTNSRESFSLRGVYSGCLLTIVLALEDSWLLERSSLVWEDFLASMLEGANLAVFYFLGT
jgi:hypothetical protein